MKASAVFVHHCHPRVALRVTPEDFFLVQTKSHHDVRLEDQITGDLAMDEVKWFFNVTRGTLINVRVLGRYSTLTSAIGATWSNPDE